MLSYGKSVRGYVIEAGSIRQNTVYTYIIYKEHKITDAHCKSFLKQALLSW